MLILQAGICLSVLTLVVSAPSPSDVGQLRELLNEILRENEQDHLQQRQFEAVQRESRGQTFLDKWLGVKPKDATTTAATVPTTTTPTTMISTTTISTTTTSEPTETPEPNSETNYNFAAFQQTCQSITVLLPRESSGNAKRDLIVNLIYDVCMPGVTSADLDKIEAYIWIMEKTKQILMETAPLTIGNPSETTTRIPTTQSTTRAPTTPISTTQLTTPIPTTQSTTPIPTTQSTTPTSTSRSTTSAPHKEVPTETPSDSDDTTAQRELKAMINREMLRELLKAFSEKDD